MCVDHPPSISMFIYAPTFLTHVPETSDCENICVDSIGKRKLLVSEPQGLHISRGKIKLAAEKLLTILFVVCLLQFMFQCLVVVKRDRLAVNRTGPRR